MADAKATYQAVCVCGHVPAHHDKRKSVYAGLMADYRVVWACGWNGCGCPNFQNAPAEKDSSND